jgi:hypothetical protein
MQLEENHEFNPLRRVNRDDEHRLFDYYGRPISPLPAFASEERSKAKQH